MNCRVYCTVFSALIAAAAPAALAQDTNFPGNVTINGDLTVDTGSAGSMYVEDDSVIDGSLCLGNSCSPTTTFANDETLKMIYTQHSIVFDDTSSSTSPNRDWTLRVNDPNTVASGGIDRFSVEDDTAGTTPFTIAGGVPENAFWLATSGDLGLGTAIPQANLHVTTGDPSAVLRLEETLNTVGGFDIRANNDLFSLTSTNNGTTPLFIRGDAPTDSIFVDGDGNVGLGTGTPEGKLHTKGPGVQLAYFESSDGDAVQVRFRTDSVNRRFLAVNNANEVKSQIVFGDDQIQFLGQTVANEWLTISDAGIISSGPTCSASPCDLTFDPEVFTVPPIEERAAYMWENMHLPAVGPTGPDQPMNMTEKMGGVIHELEVAHIYIEELHGRLEAQETRQAELQTENADLRQRLARLEEVVLAD